MHVREKSGATEGRGELFFFFFSLFPFFLLGAMRVRRCGVHSHLLPVGLCAAISMLRASRRGRKHMMGVRDKRVALVIDWCLLGEEKEHVAPPVSQGE